jgi:hypothetical protein
MRDVIIVLTAGVIGALIGALQWKAFMWNPDRAKSLDVHLDDIRLHVRVCCVAATFATILVISQFQVTFVTVTAALSLWMISWGSAVATGARRELAIKQCGS